MMLNNIIGLLFHKKYDQIINNSISMAYGLSEITNYIYTSEMNLPSSHETFALPSRYIKLIILEALRLYPQPPLLIRRSLRPDKLPGIIFSVMS